MSPLKLCSRQPRSQWLALVRRSSVDPVPRSTPVTVPAPGSIAGRVPPWADAFGLRGGLAHTRWSMDDAETPTYGRAALRWFADRSDPTKVLARRYGQVEWRTLRPAIVEIFDLDRTHHFLRAAPSFLERVHERQITVAMRNVLEGDPRRRLENYQALMDACGADVDDPLIRVIAIEADDSRRRLDLAIHAIARCGRPRCLVVEAKFKAPLQPRQLERYQATVMVD